MNNFEHIKGMSIDELAKCENCNWCVYYSYTYNCCGTDGDEDKTCERGVKTWLEETYEGE